MRRCQWERGRTNRALAEQWGCSVGAVNDYAAEAARRVRAEVLNPDEVQETVCTALSAVIREGMRDKDRRAVIAAGDVWTRIVGARSPERVEHRITAEQLQALPPAEERAKLLEAREAIDERLRQLDEAEGVVQALPEGST